MSWRGIIGVIGWCLMLPAAPAKDAAETNAVQLIRWLLEEHHEIDGVPFGAVIEATSGHRVLPLNPTNGVEQRLLRDIGTALDRVLTRMNAPDSPAQKQKRINEVSSHFEEAIRVALNEVPGFQCDRPRTTAGTLQRSGYPDLRLVDKASGRIVYLDPKLFEARSRGSSLRTFYFTPRKETNKVNEDAHHLLIGIAHTAGAEGRRRFSSWEMVDLSRFKVRLKAEFQAGNRDLYREEAIVARSRPE